MTSAVLGVRTLEQLNDDLATAGVHLSTEETARLDQASTPIVDDYPHGEFGVSQYDRGLPGPPRQARSTHHRLFRHDRLNNP